MGKYNQRGQAELPRWRPLRCDFPDIHQASSNQGSQSGLIGLYSLFFFGSGVVYGRSIFQSFHRDGGNALARRQAGIAGSTPAPGRGALDCCGWCLGGGPVHNGYGGAWGTGHRHQCCVRGGPGSPPRRRRRLAGRDQTGYSSVGEIPAYGGEPVLGAGAHGKGVPRLSFSGRSH